MNTFLIIFYTVLAIAITWFILKRNKVKKEKEVQKAFKDYKYEPKPFNPDENKQHAIASELMKEVKTSLIKHAEQERVSALGEDYINEDFRNVSVLLRITEAVTNNSELIEAAFLENSEEIGLGKSRIKDIIKTATRIVLEQYTNINLGSEEFNSTKIQVNKTEIDRETARKILKKRPRLQEGINENIKIHKIEKLTLNNDFIQISEFVGMDNLDDYVVSFEATNQETMLRTYECLKYGEYEAAVNHRVFKEFEGHIVDQIRDLEYIDIEGVVDGVAENGRPNIVIGKLYLPIK
jgi:hypothetical protein